MFDLNFLSFVFVIYHCINNGNAYDNNDTLMQETHAGQYLTTPNFALRKCHCGVNNIWENGKCLPMNTQIEFVINFSPSYLTKSINTSYFNEVIINNTICDSQMASVTIRNVAFTHNKTLFHIESGETFSHLYCVEHVKNIKGAVELEAQVCLQNIKLPICCPENQHFNASIGQCDINNNIIKGFNPPIYLASHRVNSTRLTTYVQRFPSCNKDYYEKLTLNIDEGITLQYQNSQVIVFEWEDKPIESFPVLIKLSPEFCIAIERRNQETIYNAIIWDQQFLQYCSNASIGLQDDFDQCDKIMNGLLLILLSVSSIFLLLILVLHFVMPELRKSLGSKITICHVASLFCGFCLLLLLHGPHQFNCKVYGPLVQMTFLATFFWLNVMCFDIWWKLRCRSPAAETIQSSRAQFLRYSFYAWGTPILVGMVTVVMDNIPALEKVTGIIVPGFGKKHCWFADTNASLIYYFGIIGVLMMANAFFFVWVFVILFKANCTYKKVLKNNQKPTARAWIYLKIFGVMGITWVCEFLSWKEGTCKYWIITDIINSLRGLILFIIFFGNKKSVNKIKQRFSLMNQSFHSRLSRSVYSLRNFSWKPPTVTVETVLESQKTSEIHAELSNRATNQESEEK